MNSILLSLVIVLSFLLLILVVSFFGYWIFVQKMEIRRDEEWREAVRYAYDFFKGDELDRFLKIIEDLIRKGK